MRKLLLVLVAAVYALAVAHASPGVTVSRETTYSVTVDTTGSISSIDAETVVSLEAAGKANVSLCVLEPGGVPQTLQIIDGAPPNYTVAAGGYLRLVWNLTLEAGQLVKIHYRVKASPAPPLSLRLQLSVPGAVAKLDEGIVLNVSEGSPLNIGLDLIYSSPYVEEVEGEGVALPYPAALVVNIPGGMLELRQVTPEPNASSSQDDTKTMYWNILASGSRRLNMSLVVRSMGTWRTISIPPVVLQVEEAPDLVAQYIEGSGIEGILNEAYSTRSFLLSSRDKLASMVSELDETENMLRSIGRAELNASRILLAFAQSLSSYLKAANKTAAAALSLLPQAINITTSLTQALSGIPPNQTLPGSNITVGELAGLVNRTVTILRSVNGSVFQGVVAEAWSAASQLYQSAKYLEYAGRMHMDMASKINEEYEPLLRESLQELDSRLRDLDARIGDLERERAKLETMKKLASMLKNYTLGLVEVDAGNETAVKSVKIKYIVVAKLPVLMGAISGIPVAPGGPGPETGWWGQGVLAVAVALAAIAVLATAARLRGGRPTRYSGYEAESIEVIESLLDSLEKSLGGGPEPERGRERGG